MDAMTPQQAQRIVAAYLKVVESHAATDTYPCSLAELPQSKALIRAAFRTFVTTLHSAGQLPPDLREYLEIAYVSLADYVDEECFTLLREYGQAGQELAADRRLAKEKVTTDAWRRLNEQGRLAGQVARTISEEGDRLRTEFQSWQSGSAVTAS